METELPSHSADTNTVCWDKRRLQLLRNFEPDRSILLDASGFFIGFVKIGLTVRFLQQLTDPCKHAKILAGAYENC